MQIKLIFTLSLILKVRVFGTTKRHFSFFHRRYGISILFFQQKMSPLLFISRSRSLSPFFSLSFAGLPPTLSFLFHSVALYSKFVDMTINLSLTLQTTRIQIQFALSVFVFIDSLSASVLQDAGGYAISRQNNLELHFGCQTCQLSYFTLVCLWCRQTVSRAVGVRSRDYQ